MTSAKFYAKVDIVAAFKDEIECSERTTHVDLKQIRNTANTVLGSGFACAWAIKFALHGLKLKAGDFVKVKGVVQKASDYKSKISAQEGFVEKATGGIGRDSDKTLVSAKRLVRAFAADITFLINKGMPTGGDAELLSNASELPIQFCFIDSWYGCDQETLIKHGSKMHAFARCFDKLISDAYAAGYLTGECKHSHATDVINYMKWRGIAIE